MTDTELFTIIQPTTETLRHPLTHTKIKDAKKGKVEPLNHSKRPSEPLGNI